MLENIELILTIFLIFYLLILFYDFIVIISNKMSDKMNLKRRRAIVKNIYNKTELIRLLSKLSYLYALIEMLDEKYIIGKHTINDILNSKDYNDVIVSLSKIYSNKENIQKIYFAYSLSKLSLPKGCEKFIFDILAGNSLYGIEDALKALYSTKDVNLIEHAFRVVSHNNIIYSSKLITDGMLDYKGDKEELAKVLFGNLKTYNLECQIAIIEYARRIGYDVGDELLEMLKSDKLDKELELAIIRYFTKVKNEKAYKLFLDRIIHRYYNQFEYEVVMIQALANYKTKEVIDVLTIKLSDVNYYIRLNSCMTLDKLTDISKLKVTDKYALDIIEYLLEERG